MQAIYGAFWSPSAPRQKKTRRALSQLHDGTPAEAAHHEPILPEPEGGTRGPDETRQRRHLARPTRVVRLERWGGRIVQDCDVYIGRQCATGGRDLPQSDWANPYGAPRGLGSRAVRIYEHDHLSRRLDLVARVGALRGLVLGCWCKDKPATRATATCSRAWPTPPLARPNFQRELTKKK